MKTAAECARSSQMPIHMENTQAKRRRGHFLKQNIYTQLYRGHILRPFFQTLARAHDSPPCMNSSPEAYLTGFCNLCFGKVREKRHVFITCQAYPFKSSFELFAEFFFLNFGIQWENIVGFNCKKKKPKCKRLRTLCVSLRLKTTFCE